MKFMFQNKSIPAFRIPPYKDENLNLFKKGYWSVETFCQTQQHHENIYKMFDFLKKKVQIWSRYNGL